MARFKVIVLEKRGDKLHYAMWADVPAARQAFYADADKVSAWKDALPADNAALQSGAVVEKLGYIDLPGAENMTVVRSLLASAWNDFQSDVTANNLWRRYGSTWDGTSWVNGGVA